MKVVVAGGSGMLGRALAGQLIAAGHDVVVLTRRLSGDAPTPGRPVSWAPDGSAGPWAAEINDADAIVNLAGAGIADKRWTSARKDELRSSRILSTRSLVTAVRQSPARPRVFIQNTGVGFYGADLSDRELDESFPPGSDFLSDLCVAWEAEAHPVAALNARLVILRSGIVLARGEGALPQMARPFRFFVGGPIGSGRQYFAWIHLRDWLSAVRWALATESASGVYNSTAPQPVTNREFSRALGRALHRPSWAAVPGFVLRIVVGELADAGLLTGQRVVPKRLLGSGFTFDYPDVPSALAAEYP